jgi:ferredoxin-thioredoxin reductase catalytic subunit
MLRLLLVLIAYRNYTTVQMDLTNAYLHADIKDIVLIIIPEGFPGAGEVALLEKGLYGTKQGSRRFYDHTDEVFKAIGLKPCPSEPCVYRYLNDDGACFVLLYVDDALLTGEKKTVQHVQEQLARQQALIAQRRQERLLDQEQGQQPDLLNISFQPCRDPSDQTAGRGT